MSDFYLHEGHRYTVKNQKAMKIVLGLIFIGLGVWSLVRNDYSQRGIIIFVILLGVAGLMFMALMTRMVFDLDKRTFSIQNGSGKPRFVQSLDHFAGLELIRQYRFFGLMRNSILNVVFDVDGKTVKMPIRQFGPGSKASQAMIEETEAFLGINRRDIA